MSPLPCFLLGRGVGGSLVEWPAWPAMIQLAHVEVPGPGAGRQGWLFLTSFCCVSTVRHGRGGVGGRLGARGAPPAQLERGAPVAARRPGPEAAALSSSSLLGSSPRPCSGTVTRPGATEPGGSKLVSSLTRLHFQTAGPGSRPRLAPQGLVRCLSGPGPGPALAALRGAGCLESPPLPGSPGRAWRQFGLELLQG